MNLYDELLGLVWALAEVQAPYAICGGLAVALHGHVRATKDIDLLVPADGLGAIEAAVERLGFKFRALPMTFDRGTESETRVHRISKIEGEETMTLDLILVGPPLESVWEDREIFEWQGTRVTVVSRKGLARMKQLANRPQDVADLHALGLIQD